MNIIRFTSTFKPVGSDYTRVALWNRYVHNKALLFSVFIPTIGAAYFLMNTPGALWWLFVLIMFYPVYHVIGFLFRIKRHFRFRSPADTAKTEFTLMSNGILMDRADMQKLDMLHWEEVNMIWELKDYLILYQKERLLTVLVKKDMEEGQPEEVRAFLIKHVKNRQGSNYRKSRLF